MDYVRSGDDLFIRLDPGEEIHTTIRAIADKEGINAGAITSGIGRTQNNVYGFMDADHVYHRWNLEPASELVSMSGNLARTESGDAFTHIHATFADDDANVHAGHMFEATVAVVAEIHLRVMTNVPMTRCHVEGSELLHLRFE